MVARGWAGEPKRRCMPNMSLLKAGSWLSMLIIALSKRGNMADWKNQVMLKARQVNTMSTGTENLYCIILGRPLMKRKKAEANVPMTRSILCFPVLSAMLVQKMAPMKLIPCKAIMKPTVEDLSPQLSTMYGAARLFFFVGCFASCTTTLFFFKFLLIDRTISLPGMGKKEKVMIHDTASTSSFGSTASSTSLGAPTPQMKVTADNKLGV